MSVFLKGVTLTSGKEHTYLKHNIAKRENPLHYLCKQDVQCQMGCFYLFHDCSFQHILTMHYGD